MKMKLLTAIVLLLCASLISADDRAHKENDRDQERRESKNDRNQERIESEVKKEVRATPNEPVVGHWNVTRRGDKDEICIMLDGGIQLDITYETRNGTHATTKIVSDDYTVVDSGESYCKNATTDIEESISLYFGTDRRLTFLFSRDWNITGDKKEEKWDLYRIRFIFTYDDDFPGAVDVGKPGRLQNKGSLKTVASSRGRSYGCTASDPIKVDDKLTVTLNSFRVQPFITANDFGQADWCTQEQTSDLIPIIIGAALAALVIIVLIAYLVGRARAKTTTYDNI